MQNKTIVECGAMGGAKLGLGSAGPCSAAWHQGIAHTTTPELSTQRHHFSQGLSQHAMLQLGPGPAAIGYRYVQSR